MEWISNAELKYGLLLPSRFGIPVKVGMMKLLRPNIRSTFVFMVLICCLARPMTLIAAPQVGEIIAGLAADKLFEVISKRATHSGRSAGLRTLPESKMLRIATRDSRGTALLLSRGSGLDLRVSSSRSGNSDWWVSPAGNGYVRIQSQHRGRQYAISITGSRKLVLAPIGQSVQQLWRVGPAPAQNRFVLESLGVPGMCLSHSRGGQLQLQPLTYSVQQLWSPYTAPISPGFQPFYRTVSTNFVPNAELTPAKIELVNTHRYALVLLLNDVRQATPQQLRVEPNQSLVVELERESGGTLVETVETRDAFGVWTQEQYTTTIPPRPLYDLSVYEEHLQSIAIDATGTSPNPIEDVNYVPKSLGWLQLPAGSSIPARGRIDLYSRAKEGSEKSGSGPPTG